MLTLPPSVRIYLAVGQVDMRRGHDGLAAIVHGQWKLDLYGGHLFVFLGRRRDRCKILFTDGATSVAIDAHELTMLLEGIDMNARTSARWEPAGATRPATASA